MACPCHTATQVARDTAPTPHQRMAWKPHKQTPIQPDSTTTMPMTAACLPVGRPPLPAWQVWRLLGRGGRGWAALVASPPRQLQGKAREGKARSEGGVCQQGKVRRRGLSEKSGRQ